MQSNWQKRYLVYLHVKANFHYFCFSFWHNRNSKYCQQIEIFSFGGWGGGGVEGLFMNFMVIFPNMELIFASNSKIQSIRTKPLGEWIDRIKLKFKF